MVGLLLTLHIGVCFLLIVVVLLQSGKSADLAGAFGGYGSQSTFGPRGTQSFLSKMTTTLAVLFMITSLFLWIASTKKAANPSVLGNEQPTQTKKAASERPAQEKPKTPDTKR